MALRRIKARHLWRTMIDKNGNEVPLVRYFTELAWKHMVSQPHPDTEDVHPHAGFVIDTTKTEMEPEEVQEAQANVERRRRKRSK